MTRRKLVELKPVKERTDDYEQIETRIVKAFLDKLYIPLIRTLNLPHKTLQNSNDALLTAIASGHIVYDRGKFQGAFDAETSKALRKLGAKWDPKIKGYRLTKAQFTQELAHAVSFGSATFARKVKQLEKIFAKELPAIIAEEIKTGPLFDSTLLRVDREVKKTLKAVTVEANLTDVARKRISEEWQTNLDIWIQDFAAEEILKLRRMIASQTFGGGRYDKVIKAIQKSFGVTERKAKFLARQETSLLMTKFKETRYTEAGITQYRWHCVAGSPAHPVRPSHKKLDGKIFSWNDPPITTSPDEPVRRNNPGQDFNCRCFARPVFMKR